MEEFVTNQDSQQSCLCVLSFDINLAFVLSKYLNLPIGLHMKNEKCRSDLIF